MGLKEAILTAADTKLAPFSAPEWVGDGQLFIAVLTGTERDRWDASMIRPANAPPNAHMVNIRARWAALVLRNADGTRVFSDDDAGELGQKSGAVLDRVWDEGRLLNRMDKPKDAEKNSEPAPSDASGSP